MSKRIKDIVFVSTALAGSLFKSEGGTGGCRYGFPFTKAVCELLGLGLCGYNSSAILAMTSLCLAVCGTGCRNRRVGYRCMSESGNGIVLYLATLADSFIQSKRCAGGLGYFFPFRKNVLVHQATRGCSQQNESRCKSQYKRR